MENKYKDKKVLILGLGLNQGGLGAARFFATQGAILRVTDLKTADQLKPSLQQLESFENIEYVLGEHRFLDFDWADLIIRNQAVKPDNKFLKYALEQGKRVEMDMGIVLEYINPSQIIGITGTKGKSTTASLIYETIKKACPERSRRVIFAGNIGKSVFDSVELINKNTLLVLELSSFQLEAFELHKVSPKYSIITNILRDHLNYYPTMEDYTQAKRVIAKYQKESDFLFLRKDDPLTSSQEFLNGLKSKIIYFSERDLPESFQPTLPGKHNKLNYAAAIQVVLQLGIEPQKAIDSMNQFKGVEFREQLIKEWDGLKIYNDTAATTPDAAIAALKTFPNSVLIAGGMDKNLEFDQFAKAIDSFTKAVYFLEGDATEKIKKLMQVKEKIQGTYNNFELILEDIKENYLAGNTVILSPGATSFNLFQNEFDRGRKFNAAVEKVFK